MKKRYRKFGSYEIGVGIIGGLTIAFGIVLFIRMLSPAICDKALSKLQGEFNIICNETVLSYIESENIGYRDIINIERNDNGEITAMNTDMNAVNKMKSSISLNIQEKLDKLEGISVKFPTNGFFGLGGGIDIPVELVLISNLKTDIASSFESMGINQTRLYITVTIQTEGKLLLAGEGQNVKIKTRVPISQTVIVGDVPGTYVNVDKQ